MILNSGLARWINTSVVGRLYHCCVVYIYHLCVVFLYHPCGSSPPLVYGFSLPTLFVGPFHLNQNQYIYTCRVWARIKSLIDNESPNIVQSIDSIDKIVWLVSQNNGYKTMKSPVESR